MTAPTPPSDGQTVTLSDKSVWHYIKWAAWRYSKDLTVTEPFLDKSMPLTAEDHRKIADVLDPPEPVVWASYSSADGRLTNISTIPPFVPQFRAPAFPVVPLYLHPAAPSVRVEREKVGMKNLRLLMEHGVAESICDDALLEAFGIDANAPVSWPLHGITYDDYDGSFEFRGIEGDWCPTQAQVDAAMDLGFERCWLCYADGTERAAKVGVITERKEAWLRTSKDKRAIRLAQFAPSVSVEREALANRIAEKIIGRPDPAASDFRMADWLLSRYSIQEKV